MDKLIEYLDAKRGRRQALAIKLGVSPSAISMWKQVPYERVEAISEATGISARDLRPDLALTFGAAPTRKPRSSRESVGA